MKRRNFIKNIFYTSSAASMAGAGLFPSSKASADALYGESYARTLVDVMLLGGADLRYMLVPHPDEPTTKDYTAKFWEARKNIYNTYDSVSKTTLKYNSFEDVWNGDLNQPLLKSQYDMAEYNGFKFGFHKKADWLKREFNKGNVAIVCNVYGSTNRRHDHSQLIVHTGDPSTNQFVYDRDGWGGRLAEVIGADANVVPVSTGVPPFANTRNAANRLDQVVHVKDSRNFALPKGNNNPVSQQSILGRALKSYYAKHGDVIDSKLASGELGADWPYQKFVQHERSIRTFGDAFKSRLDSVLPSPHYLFRYLKNRLSNKSFALQCRNLFECVIGSDILNLRTAYMEHSSWDTHHSEKIRLEKNLYDVFGVGGGLSTLQSALNNIEGANESMVYVFTSDFGRQIKVNGSNGTDHGEGSYMILVGEAVNGGVYGEMFPQSEITPDANNLTRYDKQGADIEGKTSFEHILGQACNWVQAGAGASVFPVLNSTTPPPLETNVDPSTLFNPGYRILGEVKLANTNYHLNRVTVTAANQAGVTKTDSTMANQPYNIQGVSNNAYLVTPSKPYFTFAPTSTLINVSGSDVTNVDFVATAQLHISNIFYNGLNWSDNTERLIILSGYNFVAGETQVTIDGVAVRLGNISSNYFWMYFPATVTTGEIAITTPSESYIHPVRLEEL